MITMGLLGKLAGALVKGVIKETTKAVGEMKKAQGMSDRELVDRAFNSKGMERSAAIEEFKRRHGNNN